MVASWPNTKRAPPISTRITPQPLPSKGIRSRRSLCCQIKNAATGGINRQWLYSGLVIHADPMTQTPSQNNHRLNMPTHTAMRMGPQVKRQTKPATALRSNEFEDILILSPAPSCRVRANEPAIDTELVLQERDAGDFRSSTRPEQG
jgi:hypothetical protein